MVYKSSTNSGGGGGGSGTVTQIDTGTGLTGGPITSSGTISVADSTPDTLAGYDNSGVFSDVTIGTNLTLSGGVLNASGSGGSSAFNDLTGGTNTTATMVVGTGASLATSGSGTITATAVPVSGISGLGTGIATFLATPSSANLATAVTDETGSGALVFGTAPSLTTPNIGVATGTSLSLTADSNQIVLDSDGTNPGTITIASLSATRTWTMPNASGTVCLVANTATLQNKTIDNSNTVTLKDTLFTLQDDGDATKQLQFQLSGITTGNTRTLTVPDLSSTIAVTGNNLSVFSSTTSAQLAGIISDETGSGALVFANTPTLTTAVLGSSTATTQSPGDNSTKVATTAYVQAAIFATDTIAACKYATTAALTATYSNGSSGVGATLTEVGLGALVVDGVTPSVNDRILVKTQASTFQNGVYTVTVVGSAGASYVLTRATDYNVSADINLGDTTFVTAGSTLAATTWTQNGTENPVVGTDAITFAQTAGPGSYTAGNGLTLTGTSFAIDTSITVDKTTAQTLTNKTLTSPVMTAPVLGTPSSGTLTNCTFPTLNQNTTGSAASLSVSGQTGLMTVTGLASTNRVKTVRDAADTLLELGGSYTPTGTWTNLTMVTPVLGTPTSGTLSNCTTATQTAGDNSTKLASTAYVNDAVNNIVINTQSNDYTLVLTDNGKFIDMTKGTATTLTIPPNSGGGSVAFPIGAQITIRQGGGGQVTVAITTDTLNNPGATLKTRVQYSQFVITKMASTTWTIIGDAAAT